MKPSILTKILALVIMLVTATSNSFATASADSPDTTTTLRVVLKDRTEISFVLQQAPVISFIHDSLCITTAGHRTYLWHGDVAMYTFGVPLPDDTTSVAIEEIVEEGSPFDLLNGEIIIHHSNANLAVTLYTIDGRVLHRRYVNAGAYHTIPLRDKPTGVYLLQINNRNFKIVNL